MKTNFHLYIAPVLAALCLSTCPVPAAQPLQAGIEHSEKLPQVDRTFLPGSAFQNQKEAQTGEWVRIPPWLAGTWQADKETATLRQNIQTGQTSGSTPFVFKAKIRFSYGMQKDLSGGIWHYISTPYTSATDMPEFTEYHHVGQKKIQAAEDKVGVSTRVVVARVGRQSRLIEEAFQQESITNYSPLTEGFIKLVASTKTYDVKGTPMMLADNEAKIQRVTPFSPVDTLEGKDLRPSFQRHLQKIGYGHLAPVGLKAEPAK